MAVREVLQIGLGVRLLTLKRAAHLVLGRGVGLSVLEAVDMGDRLAQKRLALLKVQPDYIKLL